MRRVFLLFVALLAFAGVIVSSSGGATQAQPHLVIKDLGPGDAVAINNRTQVVIGTTDRTTTDMSAAAGRIAARAEQRAN